MCLPFSGEVYFSESTCLTNLSFGVLSFLVLLWVLLLRNASLFDDTVLVFWAFFTGSTVSADVDSLFFSAESSIFPSDALGGPLVDFPFYPSLGGSFTGSSVTPVRRREDTDRNGDAGVEVQVVNLKSSRTLDSPKRKESSRLTS